MVSSTVTNTPAGDGKFDSLFYSVCGFSRRRRVLKPYIFSLISVFRELSGKIFPILTASQISEGFYSVFLSRLRVLKRYTFSLISIFRGDEPKKYSPILTAPQISEDFYKQDFSKTICPSVYLIKGIFWGLCINRFLMTPLHYLSSRSDFGFEFVEIFVIKKRLSESGVDKIF